MLKRLTNMTLKSNRFVVLTDQALVSGVNFLMAILLTRFLGLENFGFFAFGWMLVLFVSSVQLAFIISPLYTLTPKHENPNEYVSSTHSIQLAFSAIALVASFVVVLVVFQLKPEWNINGVNYSLPLVASLFILQDFYRRANFINKKPLRSLISDGISYGLQPVVITVLHLTDSLSIHTAFLGISGLFVCSILYNMPKVNIQTDIIKIKNTMLENWSFSKYLVGTSLLQWVSGNFFLIVAGGVLGPVAIGAVRIAQNIVGVLHVLFLVMDNIIPIKGAEVLTKKGAGAAINYFKKMMLQGGVLTFTILLIIAIMGNTIIDIFYGEEYIKYYKILLGYTGIYVLVFIGTILGFVIRTFEMNQIFFWSYIATTIFSIVAAKPIIHQFGIYGVIIGLLVTQIINISFYLIRLNSKLRLLWK